jgi:hypothetical protein
MFSPFINRLSPPMSKPSQSLPGSQAWSLALRVCVGLLTLVVLSVSIFTRFRFLLSRFVLIHAA